MGRLIGLYKHGEAKLTPEYTAWEKMKKRCRDKNYEYYDRYGGRGITVCDEWINDYSAFLAYVGRKPSSEYSLERIRNNEGYKPGNVKWADKKEQANNRSNQKFVTFNKETLTISAWADRLGVSYKLLYKRIFICGWDIERALTEPRRVW